MMPFSRENYREIHLEAVRRQCASVACGEFFSVRQRYKHGK